MRLSFHTLFYPLACSLFVGVLLLPLADQLFCLSPIADNNEKRVLAKIPAFKKDSIHFFSKEFELYYNDNFGFRRQLILLNSKLRYHCFHSSPTPDKVGLGKEDWLFLTGPSYNITQDLTRSNSYKGDELKEAVTVWENRKHELKQRQIHYYKAFWPDKNYIYPELMPLGMKLTDKGGPHKCDQAILYLQTHHSPVKIIDVRDALLEAKNKHRIYFKDDSHWNNYGAFIAYTGLMNAVSEDLPKLKPYTADDFEIDWQPRNRTGDLCDIINMDWREVYPVFVPRFKFHMQKLSTQSYPDNIRIYHNAFASTDLKALVYGDSYTEAMEQFLMCHFKEIVFIWYASYSNDMVNRVKPDVVIECPASRDFR